ncbi:glycogen/starch/alpha-glucan family phosphorylase [Aquibacillus halophilus]|uniref:Alpha-1,4 glucan phosphorylase n=1 Tax=Aquibacillus halophilus TaxID=930132 RepID=A0A6A8DI25_9BACI|nr:glycogen/starch/alpha-glucan phosphorylase [Aquibacillus halophilus]MRH43499.1 glycogen/starch/alpha-glucan family phosphorylase [Aquibacillus halophilus]
MTKWTVDEFIQAISSKTEETQGKTIENVSLNDVYYAVSAIVNEEINSSWTTTNEKYQKKKPKQVYYLSMEFLIGGLLESNLLNSGMWKVCNEALEKLGFDPVEIYRQERDPGLGNGGLGRLAACFLDSMASLQYPGHGYGIRYRYGMFEQRFINGYQTELPDYWLKNPYPWERRIDDESVQIEFGGTVHMLKRNDGSLECKYENTDKVLAVPYDVPVVGYQNQVVNTLRLWSAEPVSSIDEENTDEYYHQLDHNRSIEQISGILYPDDSSEEGKRLRVKQQYFLVAASLKKIVNEYKLNVRQSLIHLPKKVVIQINDTHPSLAIPELMRMLMDDEGFGWDVAWNITTNVFAYTNHTILSEALEKWPIDMIKSLLPRLYMIIDEINERFCQGIWFDHHDLRDKIPEMAIIADNQIHMARLAIVGSFSVNGVAKLHTEIIKTQEMKDFYKLYPKRFNNKTNGITHRRWLLMANPRLSDLITETIGPSWIKHPRELTHLLRYTKDRPLLEKLGQIKQQNKQDLAQHIHKTTGIVVDDQSIFDVQIKRLHEYKRQLLNIFHVIYLYNELKENPQLEITPRTFIFGAKAAPSYYFAKEVIKLINTVASIVNNDPSIKGKIKVVFLENYNVSLAEKIIPAADLSEQISTAGKEASGTGNMKMMMNGALTIGTLDGANVEIKNLVGNPNIFIFGLRSQDVYNYYQNGEYSANGVYENDERISQILHQLRDGTFGQQDIEFKDIYYHILSTNDPYFILEDFDSYVETQQLVDQAYRNNNKWLSKSLVNIAHSGKFSSDRTIQEYATGIWRIKKQT